MTIIDDSSDDDDGNGEGDDEEEEDQRVKLEDFLPVVVREDIVKLEGSATKGRMPRVPPLPQNPPWHSDDLYLNDDAVDGLVAAICARHNNAVDAARRSTVANDITRSPDSSKPPFYFSSAADAVASGDIGPGSGYAFFLPATTMRSFMDRYKEEGEAGEDDDDDSDDGGGGGSGGGGSGGGDGDDDDDDEPVWTKQLRRFSRKRRGRALATADMLVTTVNPTGSHWILLMVHRDKALRMGLNGGGAVGGMRGGVGGGTGGGKTGQRGKGGKGAGKCGERQGKHGGKDTGSPGRHLIDVLDSMPHPVQHRTADSSGETEAIGVMTTLLKFCGWPTEEDEEEAVGAGETAGAEEGGDDQPETKKRKKKHKKGNKGDGGAGSKAMTKANGGGRRLQRRVTWKVQRRHMFEQRPWDSVNCGVFTISHAGVALLGWKTEGAEISDTPDILRRVRRIMGRGCPDVAAGGAGGGGTTKKKKKRKRPQGSHGGTFGDDATLDALQQLLAPGSGAGRGGSGGKAKKARNAAGGDGEYGGGGLGDLGGGSGDTSEGVRFLTPGLRRAGTPRPLKKKSVSFAKERFRFDAAGTPRKLKSPHPRRSTSTHRSNKQPACPMKETPPQRFERRPQQQRGGGGKKLSKKMSKTQQRRQDKSSFKQNKKRGRGRR
jgi:hypothetical protein